MLTKPDRKPGVRLTDDQKRQAVRRYMANEKVEAIAKDFNVACSVISQNARFYGVSRGVGKGRKKPDGVDALADLLAAEGQAEAERAAPHASSQSFYSPTQDEILRLFAKGVQPSRIVALLRVPYADVNTALSKREGTSQMNDFMPKVGKTVVFRLNHHAVTQINGKRFGPRKVKIGDEYPLLITQFHGAADDPKGFFSGKVETGEGEYFASSVCMGEAAGECRQV